MQKIQQLIENSDTPIVSIVVLTYNHEHYITKCLQSILAQKTQYQVELIIHDDASTDNTVKVIEQLIPTKSKNIKKIYSEINKFSQGKKPKSPELITNHVTGKFFTIVDGDDYWEGDYYRVEKMIAALMNDQDASFSFSDVKKFNNVDNDKFSEHLPERNKRDFPVHDLKRLNYAYIHLGATFFRNVPVKFPEEFFLQFNGDTWFPILWGEFGYGKFIPNCGFLAYRINEKGMWSSQNEQEKEINRTIFACQMTSYLLKKGYVDAAIYQAHRFNPIMLAHQRAVKSA